jgi:hypothetical protein
MRIYKKLDEIGTWATHEILKLEKCTHRAFKSLWTFLKKMKLELHMKYQTFCEPWKPKPCENLQEIGASTTLTISWALENLTLNKSKLATQKPC